MHILLISYSKLLHYVLFICLHKTRENYFSSKFHCVALYKEKNSREKQWTKTVEKNNREKQ